MSAGKEVGPEEEKDSTCPAWNIGTLTGMSMELVDAMKRRRINTAYLWETK